MSKNEAFMAFYPGDYLADTMHLTTLHHGAYCLLLMHYWRTGPLPDNDLTLATIARMTSKAWASIAPVIRAFFTTEDGKLHQKRADIELAKRDDLIAKRSSAGRAGAEAKWSGEDGKPPDKPGGKANGKGDGKPIANAQKSMANGWQTDADATSFAMPQLPKEVSKNLPLLATSGRYDAREEASKEGVKTPISQGVEAHEEPAPKPARTADIVDFPQATIPPHALDKVPVSPVRTPNQQIDEAAPKPGRKHATLTPEQLQQIRAGSGLYPPGALFVRKAKP